MDNRPESKFQENLVWSALTYNHLGLGPRRLPPRHRRARTAAPWVREAAGPWAAPAPASTDAKRARGPLTAGLDVPATSTSATGRAPWSS
ncbi:hypothetical protein ACFVFI_36970 [Streptomyces sp. NPDC057705]|uniref:hypothetical protein n=1 Tax=Streptomyces sp. NPDC057705 TaxID=3346222 RepID=UPI0036B1980F